MLRVPVDNLEAVAEWLQRRGVLSAAVDPDDVASIGKVLGLYVSALAIVSSKNYTPEDYNVQSPWDEGRKVVTKCPVVDSEKD